MNDFRVAPGMPVADPTTASVIASVEAAAPCAEYPPPRYWRRWSSDAPEPQASSPAAPHATTVANGSTQPIEPDKDTPYRVLVVEDDPSQALFAASVLEAAGMRTQVAADQDAMLAAMESFDPELVLMDLHLPGANGIELAASIRAQPSYLHTPIVFLTGDSDPELQIEALENGGDDFLTKPIKPRHLIAAVHSRIHRARALQRLHFDDIERHPVTGLHTRPHLLQRIAAAIAANDGGGALFVEIQHAGALRERYGYADFEQLMLEAGRRLGMLAGDCHGARLNDYAFLVLAPGTQALEPLAASLRDGLAEPVFDASGMPQRLLAAIGHASLGHGFAGAGNLLDALEQSVRLARAAPSRLHAWHPPEPAANPADGLADAMREGLRDGALQLAFQPVVAVAGGNEAQFQVLLRLRDAEGTARSAGELVPVAEAAGLMPDIDRWVLQEAIDLLHQKHVAQSPVRLFVSQSPMTLARDLHGGWLLQMLESHGVPGPSLVIDLRLDDALVHSLTLRRFCDLLMPAGVQFSLSQYVHDDEADALLTQLPLGYLRLAARYSHAHADPKLRDELRTVIDRAHRLGLQVIGPQVEDPQGAATLWMSGIDFIQGNLVQQALDAPDFDFQHSVL